MATIEFSEWKKKVLMRLIGLASESNNEEERKVLDVLIRQLRYLRYRDLSGFLADLWAFCDSYKKYDICREFASTEITE